MAAIEAKAAAASGNRRGGNLHGALHLSRSEEK
jgi:hypothetical protein